MKKKSVDAIIVGMKRKKKKLPTPQIKEKQFQAQVIKALGWLVYHTYDSRKCEPGFPDLVLVRDRTMYRELKTEKGRLTKPQRKWGDALKKAGEDYKVWRPSMTKEIEIDLKGYKVS